MMAETLAELQALTDDEVIKKHDRLAEKTVVGTRH